MIVLPDAALREIIAFAGSLSFAVEPAIEAVGSSSLSSKAT